MGHQRKWQPSPTSFHRAAKTRTKSIELTRQTIRNTDVTWCTDHHRLVKDSDSAAVSLYRPCRTAIGRRSQAPANESRSQYWEGRIPLSRSLLKILPRERKSVFSVLQHVYGWVNETCRSELICCHLLRWQVTPNHGSRRPPRCDSATRHCRCSGLSFKFAPFCLFICLELRMLSHCWSSVFRFIRTIVFLQNKLDIDFHSIFQVSTLKEQLETTVQKLNETKEVLKTNENGKEVRLIHWTLKASCLKN